MNLTPVAVFTYNRPLYTRQLLESLSVCSRLDECRVVIFSDAPRIPEHTYGVDETRRVISDWAKKNKVMVIERTENWGLARSIVGGVNDLCEQDGRVIVLEDDMVVSPRFLDYMLSALDRYQEDERVCQISGYMFPIRHLSRPDAFFLPLTTTWGWATWKRAWSFFQWDVSSALIELKDPSLRFAFDLDGVRPLGKMLEDCIAGRIDSWGIRWWWIIFKSKKLVLHPRHSLVWVGGFDGTGTNNGFDQRMMPKTGFDPLLFRWNKYFDFPMELNINWNAHERIKKYFIKLSKPTFRHRLKEAKIKVFSFLTWNKYK